MRERRSSRGSEEREIRIRRDLTYMMDNNARRSSASRNSEEERRGVRERSRRRERERRDRLDRLESLDCDHPLQEVDPFIGKHCLNQRVKILDPNQVYDTINLGRRIDVLWPSQTIRNKGGKSYWKSWLPEIGMEGMVVHRWVPNHPDSRQRSHVDRVILLLQVEDKYVPIAESAVEVVYNGGESSTSEGKPN